MAGITNSFSGTRLDGLLIQLPGESPRLKPRNRLSVANLSGDRGRAGWGFWLVEIMISRGAARGAAWVGWRTGAPQFLVGLCARVGRVVSVGGGGIRS